MKKSFLIRIYVFGSTALVLAAVAFLFAFITVHGIEKIGLSFLFTAPKGFDTDEGGIFPAIVSTLYLGGIAGITGLVCALSVSLFLCFFIRQKRIKRMIHLLIYALAAIPSIILGLFGYAVFVKSLYFGKSLLSGGLTLGIMIFPFLEQYIEKAISEIDELLILSAYSTGLSKASTIVHIVLPMIKGHIMRATALSVSFAMGATAPIMLTAAVLIAPIPARLTDPVMSLSYHLYILANEGIDMPTAYATALVLLLLVFFINAAAVFFSRKPHDTTY